MKVMKAMRRQPMKAMKRQTEKYSVLQLGLKSIRGLTGMPAYERAKKELKRLQLQYLKSKDDSLKANLKTRYNKIVEGLWSSLWDSRLETLEKEGHKEEKMDENEGTQSSIEAEGLLKVLIGALKGEGLKGKLLNVLVQHTQSSDTGPRQKRSRSPEYVAPNVAQRLRCEQPPPIVDPGDRSRGEEEEEEEEEEEQEDEDGWLKVNSGSTC
jgi:hypothetical protein